MRRILCTFVLVGLLSGCGASALENATKATHVAGALVRTSYTELARVYTETARQALAASLDVSASLSKLDDVMKILLIATETWRSAVAALKVWEKTENASGFYAVAPCLLEALEYLHKAFIETGVTALKREFELAFSVAKELIGEQGTCG